MKTPSIIKTFLRKYGWVMGKTFILVNVTFFYSLFAFFSGLLNDCLVELFLPAPPTLQLMTPGTWTRGSARRVTGLSSVNHLPKR